VARNGAPTKALAPGRLTTNQHASAPRARVRAKSRAASAPSPVRGARWGAGKRGARRRPGGGGSRGGRA